MGRLPNHDVIVLYVASTWSEVREHAVVDWGILWEFRQLVD
jgi:hypothetical protein